MAVLNIPLERCSTAALMPAHAMFIGQRRMHFGFPAMPLGDLFATPAWAELRRLGADVRLGCGARAWRHEAGLHRVTATDGTTVSARHCVIALPPAQLEALAPGIASTASFVPSPYICVYLWFDRRLSRHRSWSLQWAPGRLNYDFYDLANIRTGWGDRDSLIASNVIHSHRAHGLSDDEFVQHTVDEIAVFLPQVRAARVVHADVHRIPLAICEPATGCETARPLTRTLVQGLMLAGDWIRTALPSSMESAARAGLLAAEAVLAERGTARALALEPPKPAGIAGWIQRTARKRRQAQALH
jgi:15-cis-phytoene desaturase